MEQIDVIFYINLEQRADRKEHFLQEMKKFCLDESKIVRIDAIYNKNGALGCTKSHIKALEQFMANPAWLTCIIFEDDFTFYDTSVENNTGLLKKFFINFKDWGMLLLASNQNRSPANSTHVEGIKEVVYSQTTSGYCIHKDSVTEVYNNFKESAAELEKDNRPFMYALDMYWNRLTMKRYSFSPNMGYQYPGYSDIENRNVSYGC
jgi:GR25 family glycosyltransferase involved in LPS biosynthesis